MTIHTRRLTGIRHSSFIIRHSRRRSPLLPLDELQCDVLILGAGGAGMLAALHVTTANPTARIVIAVKGLLGQSGCTRMVQGGYNWVLNSADSFEKHFDDTIRGGQFLNNQELAWAL